MKFLINNSPEDLRKVWIHTKSEAASDSQPYTFEASVEELESIYKGIIKKEKVEWNEFLLEARNTLGDNITVGGFFEHWTEKEQPELFEYVLATVEHFHFEKDKLQISGQIERFNPTRF